MLSVSKLLITCVLLTFACTSNKKSTAPAQPVNPGSQHNKEISKLQKDLDEALGKIAALQEQTKQGDVNQSVSQGKFDDLQKGLDTALGTADALQKQVEAGNASQKKLQQLQTAINKATKQIKALKEKAKAGDSSKEKIEELENKIAELEKKLEEKSAESPAAETVETASRAANPENTSSEESDQSDETDPAAAASREGETATEASTALTLYASLMEVQDSSQIYIPIDANGNPQEEKTHSLSLGTYVTFSSNKDVVIQKIKYGAFTFTPSNQEEERAMQMQLPVHVLLNYNEENYCYTATITRANLPVVTDDTEGKEVEGEKEPMKSTSTSDCS